MSPEQIEGHPVDGRTDQYGLACTVYELLCGMPPFAQHPGAALMRAHRSFTPLPVTSRRLDLPAGTDAVFERALAKRPEDRYESCSEFASSLRMVFGLGPYRAGQDVATSGIAAVHSRPVIRAAPPDASPAPIMPSVKPVYPSSAPTVQRKYPAVKAPPAYQDRTEIDGNKPPPAKPAS
jgi:serine/threonine protein kinase